ncbi:MAG: antibiotic biosynthesis monooxygenase [Methylococcaceae bacterium]|nr:antibiotic biosynthesis monooxygenase [Methylococcaceae bacterium]
MAKKLYVTSKFIAKEGSLQNIIELLEQLSSATRAEKGCLDYCYYQSTENPLILGSIEIWESCDAEIAHWSTKHLNDALAKLPELVNGEPEVMKYYKIV